MNHDPKEKLIDKLLDIKLLVGAGGLLLAGFCLYLYYQTVTNYLDQVYEVQKQDIVVREETNKISRDFIQTIERNTSAVMALKEVMLYK